MRSFRVLTGGGAGAYLAPRITSIFAGEYRDPECDNRVLYLHWTSINLDTIVGLCGFSGTGCLRKGDVCDSHASSSLVVIEENLLDGANSGGEIVLLGKECVLVDVRSLRMDEK